VRYAAAWHCLECNRYVQSEEGDRRACPACGSTALRRIDHPDERVGDVRPGDAVVAERVGFEAAIVTGSVETVTADRIYVEARDGTGLYAVAPDQIVRVHRPAG
jgi:DNA-directed RNA polymerase subunit RPC12/RpoP